MEEQQIYRQVEEIYNKINDRWLKSHLHLLFICVLIGAILETAMFFIIVGTDTLTCTADQYWLKYFIVPCLISVCITIVGCLVYKNKNVSISFKQYAISFLFSLSTCVLSLAHSGFVTVLVCAIFPILMTVMYEKQCLTMAVTIFCMISQLISGSITFWNPEKVLDQLYFINMIILMTTTVCIWLSSYYMIRFMKMKRKIIIENDIERYRLQEKVNIDGLTNVGNKLALIKRLEETSANTSNVCYLAMLDIDDFKKINDTCGHIVGDDVLRCIGNSMQMFQIDANAFRYGGDEFCILFGEPSLDAVVLAIKGVQEYLKCNIEINDGDTIVFLSVGITPCCRDKTWTELLNQADKALYESKKHHGGCITVFQEKNTYIEKER